MSSYADRKRVATFSGEFTHRGATDDAQIEEVVYSFSVGRDFRSK